MTREEKMIQASKEYVDSKLGKGPTSIHRTFIEGAKWADENPTKVEDKNKLAIFWLKKITCPYKSPEARLELAFEALKELTE